MSDWLNKLKAGDPVVVRVSGPMNNSLELKTVASATPTLIRVGGSEYRRKDGRRREPRYSGRNFQTTFASIQEPTEAALQQIEFDKAKSFALATIRRYETWLRGLCHDDVAKADKVLSLAKRMAAIMDLGDTPNA